MTSIWKRRHDSGEHLEEVHSKNLIMFNNKKEILKQQFKNIEKFLL